MPRPYTPTNLAISCLIVPHLVSNLLQGLFIALVGLWQLKWLNIHSQKFVEFFPNTCGYIFWNVNKVATQMFFLNSIQILSFLWFEHCKLKVQVLHGFHLQTFSKASKVIYLAPSKLAQKKIFHYHNYL